MVPKSEVVYMNEEESLKYKVDMATLKLIDVEAFLFVLSRGYKFEELLTLAQVTEILGAHERGLSRGELRKEMVKAGFFPPKRKNDYYAFIGDLLKAEFLQESAAEHKTRKKGRPVKALIRLNRRGFVRDFFMLPGQFLIVLLSMANVVEIYAGEHGAGRMVSLFKKRDKVLSRMEKLAKAQKPPEKPL